MSQTRRLSAILVADVVGCSRLKVWSLDIDQILSGIGLISSASAVRGPWA